MGRKLLRKLVRRSGLRRAQQLVGRQGLVDHGHYLAALLNDDSTSSRDARRAVEAVLGTSPSGQLSAEGVRRFNAAVIRAKLYPALVYVRLAERIFAALNDPDPQRAGSGLTALWLLAEDHGLERLKRCEQCGQWFIDLTRNGSKLRCTARCTWRTWNRSRRRAAGHHRHARRRP